MKILVTGGAGFIGSNFIRSVLGNHDDAIVLNYDKLTYAGNLENLKDFAGDKRYKFLKGDIADTGLLTQAFHDFKPDYVVNFAAETHVDSSIHNAGEEFINTNVRGVYNLLEIIKKQPVKKFLQISTDEVYGSLDLELKEKFNERSPLSPSSLYAATKAGADFLCQAYYKTFNLPVVITRSSNNFGPYQYPEKLIPFFCLRMLEGKKLPIYGEGKNVRNWIYVIDNCYAIELVLFKGRPGEVYNVASEDEFSNLEIANFIVEFFKKTKSFIEFVADRPGHDKRYALDFSKIKEELDWQPKYEFKEAFQKTIEWYLNNRSWLDNVIRRGVRPNPHLA